MALPTDKLCHNYLLADIQLATQNFDDKLVVGRGGFGKVYKGEIKSQESGSTIVAIKRLDTTSDQGAPEFVAEIETLSRLRHAHLVSLLGCCADNKEMIIVYEYMPNGTVDHHLHKGNTSLSWSQRLRISLGAARGLEYLHTGVGTKQGVVHRDVKSSNILLDEDWEAKISDFGLAKTCPINQSRTYVNTRIKGTFGYLDPQIFLTGNLTRKTDVFAFGVVLFELLSGRHAVLPDGDEDFSLATWAQSCVRKRNLDKLVSAEIRGELSPKCLKEFTQIAYRCLHSDPKERPTMAEVVVVLQLSERLQEQFDNSTQPAGFFGFVWKLPSYFSSPTRENSGHDDKSSSRKGKINIIRSSVANDGDLSDLHTESSGASKINSDSSSVPTTEDGGNYKDENASAKVTKAMQTFIEEHRSATELMSLRHKEELEDERPSRKNVLLHSKKTVANKRTSNIVLSDNLDAATTKEELFKAQEREQKLLEQDKKVEQTKDQRNTLKLFVYDTRSKLQNAYKRFVTESENEGILKRLQETEDWLYEDSDDECDEQIYTEKLKDLKKLLEPIENRCKDEKKVQAKKPLLAMIEENRLVADSLPLEKKMELIYACTDVEQYLSRNSPENYDLIGWSSFIKKTMDTFKSICEAVQSKLSFPEHVEPVHNKEQAAKPLLSMIEKYRSHADSLPNENKMKVIMACNEVEQYLSRHFSENYDPIGWSNFIEETMGIFIRGCDEAIEYKPSSPEHPEAVELDQSCNHVDLQTGNPTDAKQTGKSMDGTDKPIKRNQICKPVEPNRQPRGKEPNKQTRETGPTKQTFGWEPNAQTCETGPNKQTHETGPVSQTRGWEPNVQTREITGPNKQTRETGPVRQTRGWEPNVQTREIGPNVQTRETGPSKQVRETRPSKQVCETGPTNQTFGWEPNAQTSETGPNKQTRETGPVRQTCGWEPNLQTREIGPNVQTRETGPSKQVRETGPSKQVRETGPSKEDCETGPNNQVHEAVPSNQTHENRLNKQTVNMGQTDNPFDSEQMDIPDPMQIDG